MPSLPQVLHEATSRGAQEVVLESGQAPMIRTDAGAVTVGDPLTEMELFDALAQVLGPDQQAELAVGNPVEFVLTVDAGQWTMVSEPRAEGILVRGRGPATNGAAEAPAAGIDLPKLDPGEPSPPHGVPQQPNAPILQHGKRTTQWDIGVPSAPEAPRSSAPPSTPSWSKRLTDAQSDDGDFEIRTPTGEQPANLVDAHDDLAADTADASDELPELLAPPPVDAPWSGSESSVPSVPRPGLASPAPDDDAPSAPLRAETASDTASAEPVARPRETLGGLADVAGSLGPGTMCLVQGVGPGVELAAAFADGYVLVEDAAHVRGAALEAGPVTNFVVRLEDPSVALGWCLRQLEAGSRVVVETRARTAGGARRVLLGVSATARAEGWLNAHALFWLADVDGTWTAAELSP